MIMWSFFFQLVYMVNCVDGFSYMEPSLHPWDEAYLIMMDVHFNVSLDSVCKNFVEYFCINICPVQQTQLFVGARGTANLEEKWVGKKRGDQGGFLSRSQFIRLKSQVISTQWGEIGRGWGRINKEQRSRHLLTWGPKSGSRRQALCVLSPEHRSSLTALGCQAGLRHNSCPWMAWEFRKR